MVPRRGHEPGRAAAGGAAVGDWAVTAALAVALALAGWPWALRLAGRGAGAALVAGLAYLAGTALVTVAMLALAFASVPLTRASVLAAIPAVGVLGVLAERRGRWTAPAPVPGPGVPAAVPLAAAAAALLWGVVQAFRLGPVTHVDFTRAWGLKGVAVFVEGDLDFSRVVGPHAYYPLEVSNLNGAVFLAAGRVDDELVRLPGALFGVALALALHGLLRRVLAPLPAGAAVALAVLTPEYVVSMTNGLADLAVAAYVTVAVVAAFLWLLDGGARHAELAGFAAGAAAWTKLEGALTCLAVVAAVVVVRRAVRTPGLAAWAVWFAVFTVPWQVFQRLHDIRPSGNHFARLYLDVPWIAGHVTGTILSPAHWGLFWPLAAVLVVATAPAWWPTPWRLYALLALPNLVLTWGAYVTHYRAGIAGSVEATAHRLYLHLAPSVAVLAVAGAALAWAAARERRRDVARSAGPVGAPR